MRFISMLFVFTGILNLSDIQSQDLVQGDVYSVSEESETQLLNGVWDFKYIAGGEMPEEDKDFYRPDYSGRDWGQIDVPSNWELQGKVEPSYANPKEGIGLYRTTFSVPEKFPGGNDTFIRFEGVLYAYEVHVNGELVGEWASAFNSRQFNITPYLKKARENVLAVKVMTRAPRDTQWFDISDHWALSGIFRDVVLFTVPDVHFSDVVFKSRVLRDNSAEVSLDVLIAAFEENERKDYTLEIIIQDSNGKKAYSVRHPIDLSKDQGDSLHIEIPLKSPLLWTAETPYLYDLRMILYDDGKQVQSIDEKVGIREVSIKDGVLLVNNTPIKLKGVNMHEIAPLRGNALNDADRSKDLKLAKEGNINFIRTSHYPHHPRFFELADSLGFYVFAEVPFNYGPKDVTKSLDYLQHLESRAEATISSYKNRPSIIAWTLGNENRIADIYTKVAQYAARKDPTRPRAFPQSPHVFREEWQDTPDIFNLLAPHYQLPDELDSLAKISKRPIITTEFAHSLGLSMENMEENWEVVRKHPNIAGGAVWMWSDQGILRKRSKAEFLADENPKGVWADSTTYYDGNAEKGNDGIVYSNRHPQSDYWLVRKVYSPIWVSTDDIDLEGSAQDVSIELQNRFDFISLDGYTCKWSLKKYQNDLSGGEIKLEAPANSTGSFTVPLSIPDGKTTGLILSLNFYDASGTGVYEKNVRIRSLADTGEPKPLTNGRVTKSRNRKANSMTISSEDISFGVGDDGKVLLVNGSANDTLLNGSPILRVGRKPTITLNYQGTAKHLNSEEKKQFFWDPYLLRNPKLISKEILKTDKGFQIKATYRWQRQDMENESVEGDVIFRMAPGGTVTCEYDLRPINATGLFMEFGLGFSLPKEYATFRWLGDGPFVSVPGKTYYNERDVWALDGEDIRFTGNRAHTDLAAFYNTADSGIGFVGSDSNFAVENIDNHILFNHNALVSGFGTKVKFTRHPVKADEQNTIKGSFKIRVLGKNSGIFDEVFLPLKEIEVEKPFLKSYGF